MAVVVRNGVQLATIVPPAPDDWKHFCDLCRTPQEDLLNHQRVCPDAVAYALNRASLGLREYWLVGNTIGNRAITRVLGVPIRSREGDWYTTWSNGSPLGPTVHAAKAPRVAGPLQLEWVGHVGLEAFSTAAQALGAALRWSERDLEEIRANMARLRTQPPGRRRYRKADEAQVVHRSEP